jgi:hypothetical protein
VTMTARMTSTWRSVNMAQFPDKCCRDIYGIAGIGYQTIPSRETVPIPQRAPQSWQGQSESKSCHVA